MRARKPSKPPATWLLLRPSGLLGDSMGFVALRRFIKALGRQYGIKCEDIRPEGSPAIPEAPGSPQERLEGE